jgi:hypothetical protein
VYLVALAALLRLRRTVTVAAVTAGGVAVPVTANGGDAGADGAASAPDTADAAGSRVNAPVNAPATGETPDDAPAVVTGADGGKGTDGG